MTHLLLVPKEWAQEHIHTHTHTHTHMHRQKTRGKSFIKHHSWCWVEHDQKREHAVNIVWTECTLYQWKCIMAGVCACVCVCVCVCSCSQEGSNWLSCVSSPYPDSGLTGLTNSLQLPLLCSSLLHSIPVLPFTSTPLSLCTPVRARYQTSLLFFHADQNEHRACEENTFLDHVQKGKLPGTEAWSCEMMWLKTNGWLGCLQL